MITIQITLSSRMGLLLDFLTLFNLEQILLLFVIIRKLAKSINIFKIWTPTFTQQSILLILIRK